MVEVANVNEKVAINTKSIEGYVSITAVVALALSRAVHVQGAREVCVGTMEGGSVAKLLVASVARMQAMDFAMYILQLLVPNIKFLQGRRIFSPSPCVKKDRPSHHLPLQCLTSDRPERSVLESDIRVTEYFSIQMIR